MNGVAVLLGILWALLFDRVSPTNVVLGFVVARVVLAALRSAPADDAHRAGEAPARRGARGPRRLALFLWLCLYFFWELILANLAVLQIVLRPRLDIRPGLIAYPLRLRSPLGITALANMITLTPGTITADVAPDGRTLYIHSIDSSSEEAVVGVPRRFEDLLLEVLE